MSVIEEIEKRLKHNKFHEKFLSETLKILKEKVEIFNSEMAYVNIDGDYKPCLVQGVDLPSFKQVLNGDTEVYIRVMTKNGLKHIAIKDLIPLNEKSKVLYGK